MSALGIMHATRRGSPGVRFKVGHEACPVCIRGRVYIGYTAVNDDGEEVEAYHAYRCTRCSS